MGITETKFMTRDGLGLFVRVARPGGDEKGLVVLVHGMGEHSGRYPHVIEHLAERGFGTVAFDLRGHGRSEGARGYLARYGDFIEDLSGILEEFARGAEARFLYGHSMGGQIVANYLRENPGSVRGAVVTSPWLRLAFVPPLWKMAIAKVASLFWPRLTQTSPHRDGNLSRDAAWIRSLGGEGLTHRRMSAVMFKELTLGAARAFRAGPEIHVPLLVMHGEEDPITSNLATRRFFEELASEDKTLKLWPGMRHETHNELGREAVLEAVTGWLEARVQGLTTRPGQGPGGGGCA